jgi:hypothetical protein
MCSQIMYKQLYSTHIKMVKLLELIVNADILDTCIQSFFRSQNYFDI